MSVLDHVRGKFQKPNVGASKTRINPSAGSEVPLNSRLNTESDVSAALEQRIRLMARRWGYSAAELSEALAGTQSDPKGWVPWTEHDERDFGDCVTPEDFAQAYRRA